MYCVLQELMVMVHEVAFAKVVQRLSETEPAAKSASAGKPDFQLKRGAFNSCAGIIIYMF